MTVTPPEEATADATPSPALTLARLLHRSRMVRASLAEVMTDLPPADRADKMQGAARSLDDIIEELAEEVQGRAVMAVELTELRSILKVLRYHLAMLKARSESYRQIALHDALTGLANRALFAENVEQAIAVARRHGWGLAVLFIDVDQFKQINDRYGHAIGDEVLKHVATCLRGYLREGDTVGRWAGDEFTCLLLEVPREVDALGVARSMVARCSELGQFGDHALNIKVSAGVARFPADAETVDGLICCADQAMYQAKQGGGGVVLYRKEFSAG